MDNLKQKILDDLKSAMQSGDTEKRDTLRMLNSSIKDEEIKTGKREEGISSEEVISIVSRNIKQRKDSLNEYNNAGRKDLAEKEEKEIDILKKYLPEQLTDEEVRVEIKQIIKETGMTSKANFGQIMGMAMNKLKGKADGGIVKKITEEELN